MKQKWPAFLLISIMASCQGTTGKVPADRKTEVPAVYVDQDIRDASRIIEDNPGHAEALVYRGMVHVREGDYDRAIEDFTKAIEIDPGAGSTYGKRGAAHLELGELEEAIHNLKKAIDVNPEAVVPHTVLGHILRDQGEGDGAASEYQKTIELISDREDCNVAEWGSAGKVAPRHV